MVDVYPTQQHSQTRTFAPQEFLYHSDFDKKGVLFYLGTLGYQTVWQNPDSVQRQVRAFSSALSSGQPCDVLGREIGNTHTVNQPFSFFGLQLGLGRRLLPACYSIRNRKSENYVLLSWRFEASNDLVNWQLLDTRYNDLHDPQARSRMCAKGAASTWGIDLSIYDKIGY